MRRQIAACFRMLLHYILRLRLLVIVAVVLLIGWMFIFVVPNHLVHQDLVPDGTQRVRLRHDVRATLLQSLTGLLILVGAYLTWQQVLVSREGQVTERMGRAIEQLGNDKVDVRLGGIYTLGQISKNSKRYFSEIAEVLSAYVRVHSPSTSPTDEDAILDWNELPPLRSRAPDVHAALDVLARRSMEDPGFAQLLATDLRRADLRGGNFRGALLSRSDLRGSYLNATHLEKTYLHQANLRGCNLIDAHLNGANLSEANLAGRDILGEIILRDADFNGAILTKANLCGVDLTSARSLQSADLRGAVADDRTAWPDDFNWRAAGVTVRDGQEDVDAT